MSFRHQNTGVLGYCRPLLHLWIGKLHFAHILEERLLHGVYSRKQVTGLELLLWKNSDESCLSPSQSRSGQVGIGKENLSSFS